MSIAPKPGRPSERQQPCHGAATIPLSLPERSPAFETVRVAAPETSEAGAEGAAGRLSRGLARVGSSVRTRDGAVGLAEPPLEGEEEKSKPRMPLGLLEKMAAGGCG